MQYVAEICQANCVLWWSAVVEFPRCFRCAACTVPCAVERGGSGQRWGGGGGVEHEHVRIVALYSCILGMLSWGWGCSGEGQRQPLWCRALSTQAGHYRHSTLAGRACILVHVAALVSLPRLHPSQTDKLTFYLPYQCLKMNAIGINQGTSGNVSARVPGGFLITPSGIPYETLSPEQVSTEQLRLLLSSCVFSAAPY